MAGNPKKHYHPVNSAQLQHVHNIDIKHNPYMLLKKDKTEEDRSYTALNTACYALHVSRIDRWVDLEEVGVALTSHNRSG